MTATKSSFTLEKESMEKKMKKKKKKKRADRMLSENIFFYALIFTKIVCFIYGMRHTFVC